MIKLLFENIKYGSYPQHADFERLHIEYKQRLYTKLPIDCLTDNIVERLKVSLIERSLNNRIYGTNPWNADLDYLPFHGNERLIARQI